ncbi:hypothetical protein F0L74_22080 [Chitinophaga agrisoli]|uniref:Uncharacterized protein n=1 Tax=Chitinophaga agrisoli TaxID=2607653 RepID=A0A5B2VK41_9BACT|nr:hypothetical protein [Chitinophaga agrisoli]KAA2238906.1 hypothetical protein F0L74_22080 [Chitinophaga agrisoli]
MKKIRMGLVAFVLAIIGTFTVKAADRDDVYYQFYLDETGYPSIFAGASQDFLLAGCKFGEIECGRIYMAEDVQETSPGEFQVLPNHEANFLANYYRMDY